MTSKQSKPCGAGKGGTFIRVSEDDLLKLLRDKADLDAQTTRLLKANTDYVERARKAERAARDVASLTSSPSTNTLLSALGPILRESEIEVVPSSVLVSNVSFSVSLKAALPRPSEKAVPNDGAVPPLSSDEHKARALSVLMGDEEVDGLREALAELEGQLKDISRSGESWRTRFINADERAQAHKRDADELRSKLHLSEQVVARLESELESSMARATSLKESLEEARSDLRWHKTNFAASMKVVSAERDTLAEELERLHKQVPEVDQCAHSWSVSLKGCPEKAVEVKSDSWFSARKKGALALEADQGAVLVTRKEKQS